MIELHYAPWTDEEVKLLEKRQANDCLHPYTCGYCDKSHNLIPKREGWFCEKTNLTVQNWCLAMDVEN